MAEKAKSNPPAASTTHRHASMVLPISQIKADPKWNSRIASGNSEVDQEDAESLKSLSESIKKRGLLEPILVRPLPDGKHYAVKAGFRRFEACKMAGVKEVQVQVAPEENDYEAFVDNLTENEQRDALSPYELGMAVIRLRKMAEDDGRKITNEAIGEIIGKSKAHVGNLIRCCTELAPKVLRRYKERLLTMPEALKLCKLPHDEQIAALTAMDEQRKGIDGGGKSGEREAGGKVPQVLRRPAIEELLGFVNDDRIEQVKVRNGRKVDWKDVGDVTPQEMADTLLRHILKPTKEPPFVLVEEEEEEEESVEE